GAVNWQQVGADGKYPAPPLNGTGHAWHHPKRALFYTVKKGSPGGKGNMPAWEGKLTDEEIVDILAWMQSSWPDELYQAWAKNDASSRNKKKG
ncbi:MAG: cytochrome c, partial [Pseudomonadota bacterium]|nr:cytochrome c [Pseudomonadota bacterium]